MKFSRTLPALAALVLIGYAVAQTTTSGSTSQSSSAGQFGQTKAGTGNEATAKATVRVTRPTHVIVYSPNPTGGGSGSEAIWADQAVYWQKQDERGKLLFAGPWTQGNGAMMVLACENDAEAQDIADQDPVVKANLFIAHARGWSAAMIGRNVIQPVKTDK